MKKNFFATSFLISLIFILLHPGCSGTTYKVIVNVTGFSGQYIAKVTLQNNAADDLEIEAEGKYEFSTALADGADYDVSVFSRPSLLKCTLSNSTGKIDKADVEVDLTCADKQWYHPASLSDFISVDGMQTDLEPDVAMDDEGNAIVVWQQQDGSKYQIFKSEYREGSWTHPSGATDNISPDGQDAYSPKVAMDNNGNALIVWYQSDGSETRVYKSEYRSGSWTHPADLTDYISLEAYEAWEPDVAMSDGGNAVLAWRQRVAAGHELTYVKDYRGSWTSPFLLSATGATVFGVNVTMDDNNNAIVAWEQEFGPDMAFMAQYRDGWTQPTDTSDAFNVGDGHVYDSPKAAMNNNDKAIVVWDQDKNPDNYVYRIYRSEYSGGWVPPAGLSSYICPDYEDATNPTVAMNDSDYSLIAWRQWTGSYGYIYKSQDFGPGWDDPDNIDDYINPSGGDCNYPHVAMDNNNNALIVWEQTSSAVDMIFVSEYKAGSWNDPDDINDFISPSGQHAMYNTVAMSDSGDAIIAWVQQTAGPGTTRIFLSHFK